MLPGLTVSLQMLVRATPLHRLRRFPNAAIQNRQVNTSISTYRLRSLPWPTPSVHAGQVKHFKPIPQPILTSRVYPSSHTQSFLWPGPQLPLTAPAPSTSFVPPSLRRWHCLVLLLLIAPRHYRSRRATSLSVRRHTPRESPPSSTHTSSIDRVPIRRHRHAPRPWLHRLQPCQLRCQETQFLYRRLWAARGADSCLPLRHKQMIYPPSPPSLFSTVEFDCRHRGTLPLEPAHLNKRHRHCKPFMYFFSIVLLLSLTFPHSCFKAPASPKG
ncbi:hypothetical protein QBC39DRAFT_178904 [Podospora conica]|nr:hypothetical protein QBC39DRAFT_178904 [Schizothecium conicum]